MLLKRDFGLAALTVTLLPPHESEGARVKFCLEQREAGKKSNTPQQTRELVIQTSRFNVPNRLSWDRVKERGYYKFEPPHEFIQWLQRSVEEIDLEDRVLWLHLVKPYGYLGIFAWESIIANAIGNPVVRLPDFYTKRPNQTESSFDVAIIAASSERYYENAAERARQAIRVADAIAAGADQPCNIDIFSDGPIYAALTSIRGASNYRFHKPEGRHTSQKSNFEEILRKQTFEKYKLESSYESDDESRRDNFLQAIQHELGQRSVDCVHFIGNFRLALEKGFALLPSLSSESEEGESERVSVRDFSIFQAQVGAWMAGVTSPPGNLSDMAAREFVDSLAQVRPGPALYHDAESDPSCDELESAYSFLTAARPRIPVQSRFTFCYAEPFRVDENLAGTARSLVEENVSLRTRELRPRPHVFESTELTASGPAESISQKFQELDNVPAWAAATERIIDSYRQRIAELSEFADLNTKSKEEIKVLATVINNLQETLASELKTISSSRSAPLAGS